MSLSGLGGGAATLRPVGARQESTAVLGMVIFMSSWAMLFAGLFFAYGVIRLRTPAWPPTDLPSIPTMLPAWATLALGASSAALQHALGVARRERPHVGRWIGAAAIFGALFLLLQTVVWRDLFLAGLRPSSGTYASVFFGLTVFHALHVVVGLLALLWLGVRAALSSRLAAVRIPIRIWTLYWHMVGVIWGVMFVLVYLL